MGVRAYKIRHKPTGLYFMKYPKFELLTKKGKTYLKRPNVKSFFEGNIFDYANKKDVKVTRDDFEVVEVKDEPETIPLFCPYCGKPNEDKDEWATIKHHKHLCLYCNKVFRIEPYTFGKVL